VKNGATKDVLLSAVERLIGYKWEFIKQRDARGNALSDPLYTLDLKTKVKSSLERLLWGLDACACALPGLAESQSDDVHGEFDRQRRELVSKALDRQRPYIVSKMHGVIDNLFAPCCHDKRSEEERKTALHEELNALYTTLASQLVEDVKTYAAKQATAVRAVAHAIRAAIHGQLTESHLNDDDVSLVGRDPPSALTVRLEAAGVPVEELRAFFPDVTWMHSQFWFPPSSAVRLAAIRRWAGAHGAAAVGACNAAAEELDKVTGLNADNDAWHGVALSTGGQRVVSCTSGAHTYALAKARAHALSTCAVPNVALHSLRTLKILMLLVEGGALTPGLVKVGWVLPLLSRCAEEEAQEVPLDIPAPFVIAKAGNEGEGHQKSLPLVPVMGAVDAELEWFCGTAKSVKSVLDNLHSWETRAREVRIDMKDLETALKGCYALASTATKREFEQRMWRDLRKLVDMLVTLAGEGPDGVSVELKKKKSSHGYEKKAAHLSFTAQNAEDTDACYKRLRTSVDDILTRCYTPGFAKELYPSKWSRSRENRKRKAGVARLTGE
jgi:hypothetical protein